MNIPPWTLLAALLLTPACATRASSPQAPHEGGLSSWIGDTAHRLAETTADAAGDAAQTAGNVADDVAAVTSDAAYDGAQITDDVVGAAGEVAEADDLELELALE